MKFKIFIIKVNILIILPFCLVSQELRFGTEYDDRIGAILKTDSGYVATGIIDKGNDLRESIILQLDDELNIIKKLRYQPRYENKIGKMYHSLIFKGLDNGYLVLNKYLIKNYNSQNTNFMKYDNNFNLEWQSTFGIQSNSDDKIFDLILLDSTYIMVGDVGERGHIARMDKNGNMVWSKLIKTNGTFYWSTNLVQISDTEFIFQGFDHYIPNKYQQLIGKFDINGNVHWIKKIKTDNHFNLGSLLNINDTIYASGILGNNIFINKFSIEGEIIEFNLYKFENNVDYSRLAFINSNKNFKAIGYFNTSGKDEMFTLEFSKDLEFQNGFVADIEASSRLLTHQNFEDDDLLSIQHNNTEFENWDAILSKESFEDIACATKEISNVQKIDYKNALKIENLKFTISNFDNTLETELREVEFEIEPSNLCDVNCYDEFNFNNFSKINNLSIVGDAKQKFDTLQLTNDGYFRNSGIWYEDKVSVNNSFTTEFSFIISKGINELNEGSLPGADGITFTIQNSSNNSIGGSGGGLGYQGISNGISFELDTYKNFEFNDPDGNHFAVQNNGVKPLSAFHSDSTTIAINDEILEIKSDGSQVYFIKIVYEDNSLEIFLSESENYSNPIISLSNFNINDYMFMKDGMAYVGITSATGNSRQQHDLISWKFCSSEGFPNAIFDNNNDLQLPYPNPATSYIIIPHLYQNNKTKLYNSMGQPILDVDLKLIENKLILNNLSPGAYFLKSGNNQFSFIKK